MRPAFPARAGGRSQDVVSARPAPRMAAQRVPVQADSTGPDRSAFASCPKAAIAAR